MPYIGKSPSVGVRNRFYFTASGGETSLSGADSGGRILTFSDGKYVDVMLNGVTLVAGTDYNTTTANTIAGLTALTASDIIEIVVYDVFSVPDAVSAVNGGTFQNNINVTGTITADELTISENVSSPVGITINNPSGSTNGDAILQFTTPSVTTTIGIDATGTDIFKISNSSALGTSDVLAIDSSGNVGIGTSSPVTPLQIKTQTNGNAAFQNSTSVTGGVKINAFNDAANASVPFEIDGSSLQFNIASVEKMRIDSSGNVGIGTSSPVSKLDLASGNITISNSTNAPYINFVENTTRSQSLSRITMDQVSGTAGQLLFSTTTGGTLSERMRIDSSGNVGIGGSPDSLLHVAGAANLRIAYGGTSANYMDADTNIFRSGNGIERLRIDSSGRMTMPYQPAFSYTGLSNSWATTGAFQTLIPATTKINRGNHYNGNTGVFTAPVSGVYFFGFWGLVYSNTGQALTWQYSLNGGSGSQAIQSTGSTGNHTNTNGTVILSLAANDTVTLDVGLGSQTTAVPWSNQWNMYGYLMF